MSQNFVLIVNSSPQSQGAYSAFKFATALLEQGQTLSQVFELITCVAASLRRGVVDSDLASDQQLASSNLASGFRLGGLGEFVTTSANADKLVQF
ncbi:MAG: DsrE family protein [Gammaproteobacteria bacterium]|nr:DsrE family protein [Gammaproteobacteria bacterium]